MTYEELQERLVEGVHAEAQLRSALSAAQLEARVLRAKLKKQEDTRALGLTRALQGVFTALHVADEAQALATTTPDMHRF